jgi:hypothetical protein
MSRFALFIVIALAVAGTVQAAEPAKPPVTAAETASTATHLTVMVPRECVAMLGSDIYAWSAALARLAFNPYDPFGVVLPNKFPGRDAAKCILKNGIEAPPEKPN